MMEIINISNIIPDLFIFPLLAHCFVIFFLPVGVFIYLTFRTVNTENKRKMIIWQIKEGETRATKEKLQWQRGQEKKRGTILERKLCDILTRTWR